MITIRVKSEETLCGECGQPWRECRCFAAGRPEERRRLEKLQEELKQLARQHPDVLGDRFRSKARGKERRFLLSIRKRYQAVLRELLTVRLCVHSGLTTEKSLSSDVVTAVSDVTQHHAGKSN
jgi:hypothetical protein